MMEALKANAISYAVCFVLLIIFIIYMVATVGADWSYIVGFMMALSNTYGVVLIVLLLGNGLVSIPRRLWDMGNPKGELNRLYMMVCQTYELISCFTRHRPSRACSTTRDSSWRTASWRQRNTRAFCSRQPQNPNCERIWILFRNERSLLFFTCGQYRISSVIISPPPRRTRRSKRWSKRISCLFMLA